MNDSSRVDDVDLLRVQGATVRTLQARAELYSSKEIAPALWIIMKCRDFLSLEWATMKRERPSREPLLSECRGYNNITFRRL